MGLAIIPHSLVLALMGLVRGGPEFSYRQGQHVVVVQVKG